jgi:citrate lyase subunit beta/citryl-CoA lyase
MATRSWLFVPGDSERKLARVLEAGADVVIVDLEDAVAPESKARARNMTAEWLRGSGGDAAGGPARWVRINPLDGELWREDLAAVMAGASSGAPAGIMVPKAARPEQLSAFSAELDALEQLDGIVPGTTRILPLVSETPAAALGIADYARTRLERLAGLTWGAEDLSAAIGAGRKRGADGEWTDLFRMVRSQVLLTAHAAGVAAIDTLFADFRDTSGLERAARASFADGFAGMLAIHPSQVPVINAAFTPGSEELARARAIVAAFDAQPGAGALQLDGQMLDRPHLEQARKLLARFGDA